MKPSNKITQYSRKIYESIYRWRNDISLYSIYGFYFGGYHKNKSAQREEEFKIEEAKELKDKL
jgi:hypothetical protein